MFWTCIHNSMARGSLVLRCRLVAGNRQASPTRQDAHVTRHMGEIGVVGPAPYGQADGSAFGAKLIARALLLNCLATWGASGLRRQRRVSRQTGA